MATNPTVELYQVNCAGDGAGEAGIVILINNATTPKSITKAVLIDAGLGSQAVKMLVKTMQDIEKVFPAYKPFKFDAVCISHWDRDHWFGLANLDECLFRDADYGWDDTKKQIKCLKYSSTGANETRFYAPTKPLTSLVKAKLVVEEQVKPIPDILKFKSPIDGLFYPVALAYHDDDLRGVEVFAGGKPSKATIDSPDDLVDSNPPPFPNAPGLYIVGANGEMADSSLTIVDKGTATATNLSSLLLLLVWKSSAGTAKISMYSGGDAEYQMETLLVTWLDGEEVTVIKGGHHGSRAGTSISLIQATHPAHYIVSPARQYGHPVPEIVWFLDSWYGYQAPPVKTGINVLPKPIQSTCFPYWLGIVMPDPTEPDDLYWLKSSYIKAGSYTEPVTDGYEDYHASLKYDPGLVSLRADPISQAQDELDDMGLKEEEVAWLALKLYEMWDDWSAQNYSSYPLKTGNPKQVLDSFITAPIQCIKAEFSLVSDEDVIKFTTMFQTASGYTTVVSGKNGVRNRVYKRAKKAQGQKSILGSPMLQGKRYVPRASPPADRSFYRLSSEEENDIRLSERVGDLNPYYITTGSNTIPPDDERTLSQIPTSSPSSESSNNQKSRAVSSLPPTIAAVYPTNTDPTNYAPLSQSQILFIDPPPDSSTWSVMNNTYSFLYRLHSSSLTLATAVTPDVQSNWTGSLADTDEWQVWFQNFFDLSDDGENADPYISSITASGSSSNSSPIINFAVAVKIGDFKLVYSSVPRVLISSLGGDPGNAADPVTTACTSVIDNQGIWKSKLELQLTVDQSLSSTSGSITLDELFQWAGLQDVDYLGSTTSGKFYWKGDSSTVQSLWFSPTHSYETTLKLQLLDSDLNFRWFLEKILTGLTTREPYSVIVTRTSTYMNVSTQSVSTILTVAGTFAIKLKINFADPNVDPDWDVCFSLSQDTMSFVIQLNEDVKVGDTPTGLIWWLFNRVNAPQAVQDAYNSLKDAFKKNSGLGDILQMRQASLGWTYIVPDGESKGTWTATSFTIEFQIDVPWGLHDSGAQAVPLLLYFSYERGTDDAAPNTYFLGRIWPYMTVQALLQESLSPLAQPFQIQMPLVKDADGTYYQYYFYLGKLPGIDSNKVSSLPESFPNSLMNASLEIFNDSVSIAADLGSSNPTTITVPMVQLVDISIKAAIDFSNNTADFSIAAFVNLNPRPTGDYAMNSIRLACSFEYAKNQAGNYTWTLYGSAEYFNLAAIYTLFSSSDNDRAMDLLQEIYVPDFQLTYTYGSNGVGSNFQADGTILLGPIELDLDFQYQSQQSGSTWSFMAKLSDDRPDPIEASFGDFLASIFSDASEELPDFLKELGFTVKAKPDTASTEADDSIELVVTKLDQTYMVLGVTATVGDFEFAYAQITDGSTKDGSNVKRILKFGVGKLPSLNVPLVDDFEQPFDEMDFFWTNADLLASDVEKINSVVFADNQHPIVYPAPANKASQPAPSNNPVIVKGLHFSVVLQERNTPTCVLDYPFSSNTAPTATEDSVDDPVVDPPNATGTGPLVKTTGTLNLKSLSLKVSGSTVAIGFDAYVNLDAFQCYLQGFAVSFSLSKIQKFELSDVSVGVQGIGIQLTCPPVSIAGSFAHQLGLYSGGVAVDVDPYSILAGGEYGTPAGQSFDMLFAFAQLNGPLVELEFGSINQVTGGFGHNSSLTIPAASNITQFPFLSSGKPPGNGPLGILAGFLDAKPAWINPQLGSMWIAAGLQAEAFQVLDIDAVVTLDLGSDVIFGIFADCNATVPDKNSSIVFARAEMGLEAIVDFGKGVVQIEGQMTPRSFVLDPNCHLTGGFALCYWFDPSGHDGDWVFTIGGYHSAFQKPDWYPDVPRVGISWTLDSHISIVGNAYFAITPQACMGGGLLKLTFELGDISAYYDAYADFMVNYKPFSFVADVSVTVGVAYTMRVCRLVKRFHIDYGAAVHLVGPPTAGYVRIKWIIISFDIGFGPSHTIPPALKYTDFESQLTSNGTSTMHTLTAQDGLIGQDSQSNLWTVNPTTFILQLTVLFPLSEIDVNGVSMPLTGVQDKIYVKPMQIATAVNSVLTVTVKSTGDQPEIPSYQNTSLILKDVPKALWGAYDQNKDPTYGGGTNDLLSTTNITTTQAMAVILAPPMPTESSDILTVDVLNACSYSVSGDSYPVLPVTWNLPAEIRAIDGSPQALSLIDAINLWEIYNGQYPSYRIKSTWASPLWTLSTVLDSWEKYSGAETGDPLMDRMEDVLRTGTSALPAFAAPGVATEVFIDVYGAGPAVCDSMYRGNVMN